MAKKRATPPGYVLPRRPRWQGGWNVSSVLGAFLMMVFTLWGATEWTAYKLHYPVELGQPLAVVSGFPLFQPWGALLLWVHYASSRFLSSDVRFYLWIGFGISTLGSFVTGWFTYWFLSLFRDRNSHQNLQNLHGSAVWADRKTIQGAGLLNANDGVYVGGWRDPETQELHYLLHNGPEHVLVSAPTRSGKGVSCIIPTLLQWKQSAFVLDVKGENFQMTAGYRHKLGQRVLKFAPTNPEASCCYNPLNEIRWYTEYDVSDAQAIANGVIRNGGENALYKHFEDAAVDLVSAGILHLGYVYRRLDKPREVTLPDVLTLYSSPGKNIADVLREMQEDIHDPGGRSEPTMGWRDTNGKPTATHPFVAKAVQRQLNRADREGSSVQSSIVTPMTIYDDPIIQKTVSSSDFRIRDLVYGKNPMTLYFNVPPTPRDRERLRPLVRLMVELIFNQLLSDLDLNRHHLLLLLDEFPELKQMPSLANAMTTMAGYKIRAVLITQTLSQIKAEYGDNESISSNCFIKSSFQTDDEATLQTLCTLSGVMTVEKETVNYSGLRTDFYLKHVFRSVEQVQRPLITVDELRRIKPPKKENNDPNGKILEPGDMIIFLNGVAPIYGTQSLYFLNKTFLARTKVPAPRFPTALDPAPTEAANEPLTLHPASMVSQALAEATRGRV